ncbi:MAG: ATP-dependent DNA ligase, partial [Candidatus Thorarchaeota archaeon]|jgi:bifunctional non-homologous end joining protein LigD
MIEPMLCSKGEPFSSPEWFFEVKWDGIRTMIIENRLITRAGSDVTYSFPDLDFLGDIPSDTVLDGELVCMEPDRMPREVYIQSRIHATCRHTIEFMSHRFPAAFVAFDILKKNSIQTMEAPFILRRQLLENSIPDHHKIMLAPGTKEKGEALFQKAKVEQFEGVVAKRLASFYKPGRRTSDWRKIK